MNRPAKIERGGMTGTDLKKTFGFFSVSPEERRRRIRALFDAVAARYDLMNDLMSFGIHRLWKRRFVSRVMQSLPQGGIVIDLAGGTGDVARLIKRRRADAAVILVDPSVAMMREGRARHPKCLEHVFMVAAEGEALPFADDSVDAITVSFGLRNMTDPDAALDEMFRVLKPGGRLHCLEFSTPQWWLKPFYDLYSFFIIPRLGAWVAKRPEAYRYLVESIRRFPGQKALARKMRVAGFSDVSWRNLSFGIAAMHEGRKLAAGGQ